MKKSIILLLVCYMALAGCGRNIIMEAPTESELIRAAMEKVWSEQDILNMFYDTHGKNIPVEDYIVIPDYACGQVGAVLYRGQNGGCFVAYFNATGESVGGGFQYSLHPDSRLIYLGTGRIVFLVQDSTGDFYNIKLTLSSENDTYTLKAEKYSIVI